jgi:hypothetical protein
VRLHNAIENEAALSQALEKLTGALFQVCHADQHRARHPWASRLSGPLISMPLCILVLNTLAIPVFFPSFPLLLHPIASAADQCRQAPTPCEDHLRAEAA